MKKMPYTGNAFIVYVWIDICTAVAVHFLYSCRWLEQQLAFMKRKTDKKPNSPSSETKGRLRDRRSQGTACVSASVDVVLCVWPSPQSL